MHNYEINIETIIDAMHNNFAQFDIEYLRYDFYNLVTYYLTKKKAEAVAEFSEEKREYFEEYKRRYEFDRHRYEDCDDFKYSNYPFPDYFLRDRIHNNERVKDIVNLNSYCLINKQDEHFDLFFAFQLNLTDIMEIDKFLEFHLKETFENNIPEFESFLLKIMLKYKSFLEENQKPLVEHFLQNNAPKISKELQDNGFNMITKEEENKPNLEMELKDSKEKDFTMSQKVLAVHYLLSAIENRIYLSTDKTEIARFIQFLTGKEQGAKRINDTNIYDRVKTLLSGNEKSIKKDLMIIRPFFENMNLQTIVNQINKDIDIQK